MATNPLTTVRRYNRRQQQQQTPGAYVQPQTTGNTPPGGQQPAGGPDPYAFYRPGGGGQQYQGLTPRPTPATAYSAAQMAYFRQHDPARYVQAGGQQYESFLRDNPRWPWPQHPYTQAQMRGQLPAEQQGQAFGLPQYSLDPARVAYDDTLRGRFDRYMGATLGRIAVNAIPAAIISGGTAGLLFGPAGAAAGAAFGGGSTAALTLITDLQHQYNIAKYGQIEAQRRFEANWLNKILGGFAWFGEKAEQAIGLKDQVQAAVGAPDRYGSLPEVLGNLGEAWKAAEVSYEANIFHPEYAIPIYGPAKWAMDLVGGEPERRTFVDYDLPAATGGVSALVETRRRLGAPTDADRAQAAALGIPVEDWITYDVGLRYGAPGQLRNIGGQVVYDPLIFSDYAQHGAVSVVARRLGAADLLAATEHVRPSLIHGGVGDIAQAYRNIKRLKLLREGFRSVRDLNLLERAIIGREIVSVLDGTYTPPRAWELWRLTPASMATERVNQVHNFIQAYVTGALPLDDNFPAEAARIIQSIKGARPGSAGAARLSPAERAALSLEGQVVGRALAHGGDVEVDLARAWARTADARTLLGDMAQRLGDTPEQIIARSGRGEAANLLQLYQAAGGTPPAGMTPRALTQALKSFADGAPYSLPMYRAALMAGMLEGAAKWAADFFQVRPPHFVERLANTVKAAQSAVLLGLNPSYLINNVFNGEITMAARGAWGLRGIRSVLADFESLGLNPPRLAQGVGAADVDIDMVGQGRELWGRYAADVGAAPIRAAGQATGTLERARQAASRVTGSLPFTRWAQAAERWQSARAYHTGFMEWWRGGWRRGVGFDRLPPDLEAGLSGIDPRLPPYLYGAVEAGLNPQDVLNAILVRAPEPRVQAFYGRAARALGMDEADVARLMGVGDVAQVLNERLAQRAYTPENARRAVADVRNQAEREIARRERAQAPVTAAHVAQAAGANEAGIVDGGALLEVFDQLRLRQNETFIAHKRALEDLWSERLRGVEDVDGWRRRLDDLGQRLYRDGLFAEEQAVLGGLVDAMARAEMPLEGAFLDAKRAQAAAAQAFFAEKQRLYGEFFDLPREARWAPGAWDRVQAQVDAAYGRLTAEWDAQAAVMDRYLAEAYERKFPGTREKLLAWRELVREHDRAYQRQVIDHMATVRKVADADPELRNQMWREFDERMIRQRAEWTEAEVRLRRSIWADVPGEAAIRRAAGAQTGPGDFVDEREGLVYRGGPVRIDQAMAPGGPRQGAAGEPGPRTPERIEGGPGGSPERLTPEIEQLDARIRELEESQVNARTEIKRLRPSVKRESEAGNNVGPAHQSMEMAQKRAKALGFQLAALRKARKLAAEALTRGTVAPAAPPQAGQSLELTKIKLPDAGAAEALPPARPTTETAVVETPLDVVAPDDIQAVEAAAAMERAAEAMRQPAPEGVSTPPAQAQYPAPLTRADLRAQIVRAGIAPRQADTYLAALDAIARQWAKRQPGRTPDQWFSQYLAGVERLPLDDFRQRLAGRLGDEMYQSERRIQVAKDALARFLREALNESEAGARWRVDNLVEDIYQPGGVRADLVTQYQTSYLPRRMDEFNFYYEELRSAILDPGGGSVRPVLPEYLRVRPVRDAAGTVRWRAEIVGQPAMWRLDFDTADQAYAQAEAWMTRYRLRGKEPEFWGVTWQPAFRDEAKGLAGGLDWQHWRSVGGHYAIEPRPDGAGYILTGPGGLRQSAGTLAAAKAAARADALEWYSNRSKVPAQFQATGPGADKKAAITLAESGRAMIHLFERGDISSLIHETGHLLRRQLEIEADPDLAEAAAWAGAEHRADGGWTWSRDAEEKFALGFEQYWLEGRIPDAAPAGLRGVYQRLKAWLAEIYAGLRGHLTGAPLPENIRRLYDSLLVDVPEALPPTITMGQMDVPGVLAHLDNYGPEGNKWRGGLMHAFNAVNEDRGRMGLARYRRWQDVPWSEAMAAVNRKLFPAQHPPLDVYYREAAQQTFGNMVDDPALAARRAIAAETGIEPPESTLHMLRAEPLPDAVARPQAVELLARAEVERVPFYADMDWLAREAGLEYAGGRDDVYQHAVKGLDRTVTKLTRGDPEVTDALRTTFIVADPDDAYRAVARLQGRGYEIYANPNLAGEDGARLPPTPDITDRYRNEPGTGYKDVNFKVVKGPNDTLPKEIIFLTEPMYVAKQKLGGHAVYGIMRLWDDIPADVRDSPGFQAAYALFKQQSDALYGWALAAEGLDSEAMRAITSEATNAGVRGFPAWSDLSESSWSDIEYMLREAWSARDRISGETMRAMSSKVLELMELAGPPELSIALRGEAINAGLLQTDLLSPTAKATAPPRVELPPVEGPAGGETFAFGPDPNRRFDLRWRVVELDALTASHDATGRVNPLFPAELQPRQRDRAAYLAQVQKIGAELDPEALLFDSRALNTGSPIIGPDGVVENGNGRVIGLGIAAESYPDNYAAYRSLLDAKLRSSAEFGLDPAQVAGMKHPVLVRERTGAMNWDERAAFAALGAGGTGQALSPAEVALMDAARMPEATVRGLEVGESQTLEMALRSPRNKAAVERFLAALDENERGALLDADGYLSAAGVKRITAALFARTFPGEAGERLVRLYLESTDINVRRALNGIVGALGDLAQAEAMVASGQRAGRLTLADDLAAALDKLSQIRRDGRMTVAQYQAQMTLFGDELTPFQRMLLADLDAAPSERAVRDWLKRWAALVEAQPDTAQSALMASLAPAPATKELLWAEAKAGAQRTLFQSVEPAPANDGADLVIGRSDDTGEILVRDVAGGETRVVDPSDGQVMAPPGIMSDGGAMPLPHAGGQSELWYRQVLPVLSALGAELEADAARPGVAGWGNLPPDLREGVAAWAREAAGRMSEAKLLAMKWGEFRRDASLLNYTRRYVGDNVLGGLAPYAFWTTHSVLKWALHSLDRPAVLANYYRAKRFLETSVTKPEHPSRLAGRVKIPLPFLPDWMGGGVWVDPLRLGLPFETFGGPWEQYALNQSKIEQRASRELEAMLERGEITDDEYAQSAAGGAGPAWNRAVQQVVAADQSLRFDALDAATMFYPPSLPLKWAYEYLRGTPERIGPLPVTRDVRALTAALGLGPAGGVNIEAGVRRRLGLPIFDQWDDYRIDRELANMAAEGVLTVEQAEAAMIEREGPAFEMAMARATQAAGGTWAGLTIGKAFGGAGILPEAEERQRLMARLFSAAYEAEHNGETGALEEFFRLYPEYEARLALFDNPQERLQNFLIDQVWAGWRALPDLYRRQVQEAFGPVFSDAFLNKDTRSYTSLDTTTLAAWARTLGRYVPANIEGERMPIAWAPPEVAQAAQEYYAMRDGLFGERIFALQSSYFRIPEDERLPLPMPPAVQAYYQQRDEMFPGIQATLAQYDALWGGARRDFRRAHPEIGAYNDWRAWWRRQNDDIKWMVGEGDVYRGSQSARSRFAEEHPELVAYWEWRRGWLEQHPAAAPYISERKPAADDADDGEDQAPSGPAIMATPEMQRIVMAYLFAGADIPGTARAALVQAWQAQGEPEGSLDAWLLSVMAYGGNLGMPAGGQWQPPP